jgi:hypothetical protein
LYKGRSIQNLLPKTKVIGHGYPNANWTGDIDTRKSTSSYVFILSSTAISWTSKKQTTTVISSTKARYMAYTLATKEAIWLRLLLCNLGEDQVESNVIHGDNQSAIALATNPKFH